MHIYLVLVFFATLLLGACAYAPVRIHDNPPVAFTVSDDNSDATRFAPVIVTENYEKSFNRVGTVTASLNQSNVLELQVNPTEATVYVDEQSVLTSNHQHLRNLIYRVHFSEVPFQLFPFTLTAGRQGGLIIVVTLNPQNEPVLFTTVHTCGCYLAFIPTNFLPAEARPKGWNTESQVVYGERLPGELRYPVDSARDWRVVVTLRDATHRVADISLVDARTLTQRFRTVATKTANIKTLDRIPVPNGTYTSFFQESGWRQGYVKGSVKPWEFLLISWWALDPLVGVDKTLGDPNQTGVVFYTSLRPWYRQSSNLWYFAGFLDFWGWNL